MKFFENNKNVIALASLLLFLSVGLGAFGAHGLKDKLTPLAMDTFKTAVHYHQIHALALLAIGISVDWSRVLKWATFFLTLGIFIFSGCCYLYVFTEVKTFALIVPIGGVSFMIGWAIAFFKAIKTKKTIS